MFTLESALDRHFNISREEGIESDEGREGGEGEVLVITLKYCDCLSIFIL